MPVGPKKEGVANPTGGPGRVLPVPVGPKKEVMANPTGALEEGGGQPNGGP